MATTSRAGIKVERNLASALKPFIIQEALPKILTLLERDRVRLAFSNRKSRVLGYYCPPKAVVSDPHGQPGPVSPYGLHQTNPAPVPGSDKTSVLQPTFYGQAYSRKGIHDFAPPNYSQASLYKGAHDFAKQNPRHGIIRTSSASAHGLTKTFDYLHTISLQVDLNPYALLFVLLHEWAHLLTQKQYGNEASAHGREWKENFKKLFKPFFSPRIFPPDILGVIDTYFVKTSRFFETSMEEACNRYGRNRKEFARNYMHLLRSGIVLPAPYMGKQAEILLENIQRQKEETRIESIREELGKEIRQQTENPPGIPVKFHSIGKRKIADIPEDRIVRLEGTTYRIVKKDPAFALAQNLSTRQFTRIHGIVEAEILDPDGI